MNLLPGDLKKLIGLYIPREQVREYCGLLSNPGKFLPARSVEDLGLPMALVKELWEIPQPIYNLTPYEHYLAIMSFFAIVEPGSEKFLDLKVCYDMAINNYDVGGGAQYFGKSLGFNFTRIEKDLAYSYSAIGKFYNHISTKGKKYKDLQAIANGNIARVGFTTDVFEAAQLAVLYGKYDLIDQLQNNFPVLTDNYIEGDFFIKYLVMGNVKELDALFSQLPDDAKTNIVFYIEKAYKIKKNIKTSVLMVSS